MLAQVALAFFAGLAAAVHAPVGDPSGNPITRPLNEVVPAGKPFSITWEPTTPNTVSILLLRGPSTNVVPIGAPIAAGIANTGSFLWTPSTSLEADVTHYGIQLIDDVTGQYQYSTQFGISEDAAVASSSSVAVAVSSSVGGGYGYGYATSTPSAISISEITYPTEIASSSEIAYPTSTANSTTAAPVYPTSVGTSITTAFVASTGYPGGNSSIIIQPTKSLSVPASLKTSATASAPLQATGAADSVRAGLGLAGAVAGLVFVL